MTAAEAIEYLTGNELSPSTIDLLALEGLGVSSFIDADEAQEIVDGIVARYQPMPVGVTTLIVPPGLDRAREAEDLAVELIEDAADDILRVKKDERVKRPSYLGETYDEGYAQGVKDASRKLLVALGAGDRDVTSDDLRRRAGS